ncbi:MAG TPA: 2TM domain-containing protein [Acidimicrobiales bacterium]|nr:2TM domain-containing protein [Acidimicrobiales bacterium]
MSDLRTRSSPAEPDLVPDGDELARRQAVRQIERRRRFWNSTVMAALGMIVLTAIWTTGEYHNAGGWPTSGFSQSSGIPHVWNYWIIYPAIAWVLLTAAHAWAVFGHKPISEAEIRREMERESKTR